MDRHAIGKRPAHEVDERVRSLDQHATGLRRVTDEVVGEEVAEPGPVLRVEHPAVPRLQPLERLHLGHRRRLGHWANLSVRCQPAFIVSAAPVTVPAMRQLTSLDAQFLALETPRQTGHVAGLGIYDTSTAPDGQLTCADMKQLLADRLHLLPPLRWRLVEVPFNADYPYWVDDPDFDLDFHIRELALPAPGDEQQLAEQVARLHSRPLD